VSVVITPSHFVYRSRRRAPWALVAALASIVGLVCGALAAGVVVWSNQRSDFLPGVALPVDATIDQTPRSPVSRVADAVLPAVVSLEVRGERRGSTGSGFVVRSDGYIVTNSHVVSGAAEDGSIRATFSDGVQSPARIVGRSPTYDLAVLRVDRQDLPTVTLGDSTLLQVGDPLVVVGSPLGLSGTVTTGIVSALDRPVTTTDGGEASYISAIQTDAAINPGNSGGPVVDRRGRVVGIASAIATLGRDRASGNIGLGFAIPATTAASIVEQLIADGTAEYPIVGVTLDLTYPGPGARVQSEDAAGTAISPGGPADRAGMRPGDVVVAVGDEMVETFEEFVVLIRSRQPGDTVVLLVERDGERVRLAVTLDATTG
jgi:putative serine protease PepD